MAENNSNYSAKIVESSREFTARERLMMKDTGNAIKLDEATQDAPLVIAPADYAVIDVHNENSESGDYKNYIILDKSGNKYVTGSESFFRSFMEIWEEMASEDEEYTIEIYRKESKNYKGKTFITCSVV